MRPFDYTRAGWLENQRPLIDSSEQIGSVAHYNSDSSVIVVGGIGEGHLHTSSETIHTELFFEDGREADCSMSSACE